MNLSYAKYRRAMAMVDVVAPLSAALAVYSREPNETYSLTQHRLTFKLGGKVTLDSLREVFHPANYSSVSANTPR